jgi:hypothetical protein
VTDTKNCSVTCRIKSEGGKREEKKGEREKKWKDRQLALLVQVYLMSGSRNEKKISACMVHAILISMIVH